MPNSGKKKSLYPPIPHLIKTRLFYPNSKATLLNACIDFSPRRVRSERFSLKDSQKGEQFLLLYLCHKILLFPSRKQTLQQHKEGMQQQWFRQQPCSAPSVAQHLPALCETNKGCCSPSSAFSGVVCFARMGKHQQTMACVMVSKFLQGQGRVAFIRAGIVSATTSSAGRCLLVTPRRETRTTALGCLGWYTAHHTQVWGIFKPPSSSKSSWGSSSCSQHCGDGTRSQP